MIDPPDWRILPRRSGTGTAQQVQIIICEFLEARNQLRQVIRLRRRGKYGAKPGSDGYRRA
jgi:hypothetical protein